LEHLAKIQREKDAEKQLVSSLGFSHELVVTVVAVAVFQSLLVWLFCHI